MAKRKKMWIFGSSKLSKPKVPDAVKSNVTSVANNLIEAVLKPKYVRPPSGNENYNYILDIYSKWYCNYFYFCAKYACPGANAISPYFETKFARLEYISKESFNLSYMRHTGTWWELYTALSLDECLAVIRDEPHFIP